MSAHSPAPWRKKVFNDGSFNVVSFGNGFVCQYTSGKADAEEREMAEIDGSLIVAAPDLLAACREAECVFAQARAELGAKASDDFRDIHRQLRAAIARAEGR